MILTYLVYAVPLALVWVAITNRPDVESFLVGYIISLGVLRFIRPRQAQIRLSRLPGQVVALVIYFFRLLYDIIRSGLDVAGRVLSRDMRLKPGVVAVETQDPTNNPIIAALSSDVITLTPGELVIEIGDNHTMYVHCLDVDETLANADATQKRRLELLYRVIGRDV